MRAKKNDNVTSITFAGTSHTWCTTYNLLAALDTRSMNVMKNYFG